MHNFEFRAPIGWEFVEIEDEKSKTKKPALRNKQTGEIETNIFKLATPSFKWRSQEIKR